MNDNLKWFLEAIGHEMKKLNEGNYAGNVEFKVNFHEGRIKNINCSLYKPIWQPKEN